jgi:hypothetical protein
VCELIFQGLLKTRRDNSAQELKIQDREVVESSGGKGVVQSLLLYVDDMFLIGDENPIT